MTASAEAPPKKEVEVVSLTEAVGTLLEEARMILPGLQALFGFQFIVVFNETFKSLDMMLKTLHWVAILFTLMSMMLLMTPAALDRITGSRHVNDEFVRVSTRLLCFAMVPMMVSLALESYVITVQIFQNFYVALSTALLSFAVCSVLWFVFPLSTKRKWRFQSSLTRQ